MDMQYLDIEDQAEEKGRLSSSNFNEQMGFVKKVYSILFTQMAVTTAVCGIGVLSKSFTTFQIQNMWLFFVCLVLQIVVMLVLVCFKSAARTVPNNYILLGLFTLFQSYMVSFICGLAPPGLVIIAAALTMGMFFGLTLYAWTTKEDFTMCGGFLFVCAIVMVIAGLLLMFTNSNAAHILYDVLGVALFSIYIIYDTQLIMGGKSAQYDIDDYIIAALNLYIDIIQIFLYLLDILMRTQE